MTGPQGLKGTGDTMTMPVSELLDEMTAAHGRERALIADLTEPQARAASTLPGWTRAHVLGARLAFMQAVDRQIRCALSGAQADFFDGGRAGRDVQIEAHATRPADDLVSDVHRWATRLEEAFRRLGPDDWSRPVTYREEAAVPVLVLAEWRECELHCVDLDLGARPAQWSPSFCYRLFDFLEPRVPAGVRLTLVPTSGPPRSIGAGEPAEVHGELTDLAAWMAGRAPARPVTATVGTLPHLQGLREARRSR